jgi:hypothetical protein
MGPAKGGEDDRESMFLPGMEQLAAPEPDKEASDAEEKSSTTQPDMSADANPLNLDNSGVPQAPIPAPADPVSADRGVAEPPEYVEPIWMRRTKLIIFVMACIYLGIILVILPWNDAWTQNGLMHRYPTLREIAMNNFFRGAMTGLGFVNIWLGVWEAVHYREHKK